MGHLHQQNLDLHFHILDFKTGICCVRISNVLMYYLVDCDIAPGVGLLIANKNSRKGSQNVKTNNQQYLYGYFDFYRYLPSIYHGK